MPPYPGPASIPFLRLKDRLRSHCELRSLEYGEVKPCMLDFGRVSAIPAAALQPITYELIGDMSP